MFDKYKQLLRFLFRINTSPRSIPCILRSTRLLHNQYDDFWQSRTDHTLTISIWVEYRSFYSFHTCENINSSILKNLLYSENTNIWSLVYLHLQDLSRQKYKKYLFPSWHFYRFSNTKDPNLFQLCTILLFNLYFNGKLSTKFLSYKTNRCLTTAITARTI